MNKYVRWKFWARVTDDGEKLFDESGMTREEVQRKVDERVGRHLPIKWADKS